jgi:hypothetical protein
MSCQYCNEETEKFMASIAKNTCNRCHMFVEPLISLCVCKKKYFDCEKCLSIFNSLYDDGCLKDRPLIVSNFLRKKNENIDKTGENQPQKFDDVIQLKELDDAILLQEFYYDIQFREFIKI